MATVNHIQKLNNICFDKFGKLYQIKALPGVHAETKKGVIQKVHKSAVKITLPNSEVFEGFGECMLEAKEKLAAKIIREKFKNYKFKNI